MCTLNDGGFQHAASVYIVHVHCNSVNVCPVLIDLETIGNVNCNKCWR